MCLQPSVVLSLLGGFLQRCTQFCKTALLSTVMKQKMALAFRDVDPEAFRNTSLHLKIKDNCEELTPQMQHPSLEPRRPGPGARLAPGPSFFLVSCMSAWPVSPCSSYPAPSLLQEGHRLPTFTLPVTSCIPVCDLTHSPGQTVTSCLKSTNRTFRFRSRLPSRTKQIVTAWPSGLLFSSPLKSSLPLLDVGVELNFVFQRLSP